MYMTFMQMIGATQMATLPDAASWMEEILNFVDNQLDQTLQGRFRSYLPPGYKLRNAGGYAAGRELAANSRRVSMK
jgi:hypothetical protein